MNNFLVSCFKKYGIILLFLSFLLLTSCTNKSENENQRPNILWIIGEDLSQSEVGCYGNELAYTPTINKLADEGIRFTNMFTTSSVCSPARSALMTGMYQTSIGAHNHRSHRPDGYELPKDVKVLTDYFRDAGYFNVNFTNVTPELSAKNKTDWNFSEQDPFDGRDWNQRKEGQPFFAQINFPETHRDFVKNEKHPIDPDLVKLPPYYPNHKIAREDWALYLETVSVLDEKINIVLKRLEEDGLAENTVVFFFADHGRAMVRGKQWLYDPGLHIPLIIRWPGNIKPGSLNNDLLSQIDIAAASLRIAGIELPDNMQGQDFLDPSTPKREYIFAARDRCDETVDFVRAVRDREFKYIRNFIPERPYTQLNRYKETEYPVMRLLRRLHKQGKLNTDQEKFMAERKPDEELYDIKVDPFELNNLASNSEYKEKLISMRGVLDKWMEKTKDQGNVKEWTVVIDYYEELMKSRYDERLKKIYSDEGMKYIY
ncbi:MAG: sulfatase [Melioribacteraceae bacterium]|nr:sulfatase [Melioribacteraceae bacterium]